MLTLINSNRMRPPIAPIGLDYVGGAARAAGHSVELVDLAWAAEPAAALGAHFARSDPRLVGISFRNVDDCFWPSGQEYLPQLGNLVKTLRRLTAAPIVLGGVGYSIFAQRIVELVGADFGIHGDGEEAIVQLLKALDGRRSLFEVSGLVHRDQDGWHKNPPAWPTLVSPCTSRDLVDNLAYFEHGGQGSVETKRGCPLQCSYCADPFAKGQRARCRAPSEVAEEMAGLAARGIDVFHVCDAEFNVPKSHALAVCDALITRGLGDRLRWYCYAAVRPFDDELATRMRRAGCVGIDFTGDSASSTMLASYGALHRAEHLSRAVTACRRADLRCMIDLLLGGPGETEATLTTSIDFLKQVAPDAVGAALGMRLYPDTPAVRALSATGSLDEVPGIRKAYPGPVDLLRPTFYVAPALGEHPARLVREKVGQDPRFFLPEDADVDSGDHNYNGHPKLLAAIERGARGAYWDILSTA